MYILHSYYSSLLFTGRLLLLAARFVS
uniref:Uncharacterized protein n=1 Tax=Arundo donax TaxID=35708 RepID=A0A0A9C0Y0_ARUDO